MPPKKKPGATTKKKQPAAPPEMPAAPPEMPAKPKRDWRRWRNVAAGTAAGTAAALLLARYGLPAARRYLDGRVDGTIDATPAAGAYDDGMADVIVDFTPEEDAYLNTVPTQEPYSRNAWALNLLGDVVDRFDERSPQGQLARYMQNYILGVTADGSAFDHHGITSQRTGETVPLYSAIAPLMELVEPRLIKAHDRSRAAGELYDVQYEF